MPSAATKRRTSRSATKRRTSRSATKRKTSRSATQRVTVTQRVVACKIEPDDATPAEIILCPIKLEAKEDEPTSEEDELASWRLSIIKAIARFSTDNCKVISEYASGFH